MKTEKPRLYLYLKITGIIFIATGIVLCAIFLPKFFSYFANPNIEMEDVTKNVRYMLGIAFGGGAITLGIGITLMGFIPEMKKFQVKSTGYILEDNKSDLTNIANTGAEIVGDAVATTVNTVKKSQKTTRFCQQCGAEIDDGARFCSYCGADVLKK